MPDAVLPDTVLPAGLAPAEMREALRALRGMTLRQEIYALDGTIRAEHPYVVTEQNFGLRRVQPMVSGAPPPWQHPVRAAHVPVLLHLVLVLVIMLKQP